MIAKHIIIAIFIQTLSLAIFGQGPSCKSLQTGNFKAVTKESGTTFINRTKTEQTEKNDLLGYELIFDIKWINECVYELRPKKLIKGDPAILGDGNVVVTVKIKEITAKTYTAETSSNFSKNVKNFLIEMLE